MTSDDYQLIEWAKSSSARALHALEGLEPITRSPYSARSAARLIRDECTRRADRIGPEAGAGWRRQREDLRCGARHADIAWRFWDSLCDPTI